MAGGKRVLMVAPTPYFSDRGCHVQIYEVAHSQKSLGNDVRIVTYHLGHDLGDIPTSRTLRLPWYDKRDAGPSAHKFYLDALLMEKTLRVALAYKPDILHAHMHEGAALALPIARLLRLPLVLDLQGSLTGELVNHRFIRKDRLPYRLLRAAEERIHHHVDAMLMWTYIRESLQSMFAFDQHKVFPVDYGVDLRVFYQHPKATLDDLYAALNLPRDRKIVVYLGVLNAYQGVDCLLDAIPAVLNRHPNTHFLLMGYPNEARYRERASALGIDGHVTLPGRIDYTQAARYLSLGDVAVSAKMTAMEGNGKLLNYLACGLPTVAFDLPGNLATLKDVGTFAPLGDSTALAAGIAELLSDDARRADLSRRSRLLAETCYSWDVIGRVIDSVYDEVIARRYPQQAAPLLGTGAGPIEPVSAKNERW
jgi:glycosyltransferase involved in cell wall biosynthesis